MFNFSHLLGVTRNFPENSLTFPRILSGNQLVQFLIPMNYPDYSDTAGWVIYMVVYYVVFGIFLLNVTLAVIVDTFGGKK